MATPIETTTTILEAGTVVKRMNAETMELTFEQIQSAKSRLKTDLTHCLSMASKVGGNDKRALSSRHMADDIIQRAVKLDGHSMLCDLLRDTFSDLDAVGAFDAGWAQIEMATRKKKENALLKEKAETTGLKRSDLVIYQSEIDEKHLTKDELDKIPGQIKKSNKQRVFKGIDNSFSAFDAASNATKAYKAAIASGASEANAKVEAKKKGVPSRKLESNQYNFRIVTFKAEIAVQMTPLEKWLEKGQDWLGGDQIKEIEQMIAGEEIRRAYWTEQDQKRAEQRVASVQTMLGDADTEQLKAMAVMTWKTVNAGSDVEPTEEQLRPLIAMAEQLQANS